MCLDSCWAVWVICDSSRYSVCLSVSFFMSVHFYESQCIAQPLFSCIHQHLPATAASKRQHSWDWSHLSEIYPAWSLGAQEGHRRPAHSHPHPPGTGCLATLADCVSRVKKGSGMGRRNQITPIDHLLSALLWELRPWPQNQSPAIMSEKGGYYAHRGAERDVAGFVWLLSLTSHTAHHGLMLRLLTVTSDVIVIEDLP